jgi:hypothetical protein
MAGYPNGKAAAGFADNVHEDEEQRSCALDLDGKGRVIAVSCVARAHFISPGRADLPANLQLEY